MLDHGLLRSDPWSRSSRQLTMRPLPTWEEEASLAAGKVQSHGAISHSRLVVWPSLVIPGPVGPCPHQTWKLPSMTWLRVEGLQRFVPSGWRVAKAAQAIADATLSDCVCSPLCFPCLWWSYHHRDGVLRSSGNGRRKQRCSCCKACHRRACRCWSHNRSVFFGSLAAECLHISGIGGCLRGEQFDSSALSWLNCWWCGRGYEQSCGGCRSQPSSVLWRLCDSNHQSRLCEPQEFSLPCDPQHEFLLGSSSECPT